MLVEVRRQRRQRRLAGNPLKMSAFDDPKTSDVPRRISTTTARAILAFIGG